MFLSQVLYSEQMRVVPRVLWKKGGGLSPAIGPSKDDVSSREFSLFSSRSAFGMDRGLLPFNVFLLRVLSSRFT